MCVHVVRKHFLMIGRAGTRSGACVLLMECILIAVAAGRSFIPLEIFCGRVGAISSLKRTRTHMT